jgi:hypothetical protein
MGAAALPASAPSLFARTAIRYMDGERGIAKTRVP